MHPAPVAAFAAPGTRPPRSAWPPAAPSTRQLFFGYIPVAARDALVPPLADPGAALQRVQAEIEPARVRRSTRPSVELHRPGGRALEPAAPDRAGHAAATPNIGYASLFLLLDLLRLAEHLPADAVYADRSSTARTPAGPRCGTALLDALQSRTSARCETTPADGRPLDDALAGGRRTPSDLVDGTTTAEPEHHLRPAAPRSPATWLGPTKTAGIAGRPWRWPR